MLRLAARSDTPHEPLQSSQALCAHLQIAILERPVWLTERDAHNSARQYGSSNILLVRRDSCTNPIEAQQLG